MTVELNAITAAEVRDQYDARFRDRYEHTLLWPVPFSGTEGAAAVIEAFRA